jgi:HD-GYP domain-containing protein (c-di-GMP phosphodiesterase class II)
VADAVAKSPAELDFERLVEARERLTHGLKGLDRWTTVAGVVAFLMVAGALAVLPPSRALAVLPVLVLVTAYALASRVEFEIGSGSAIPTQIVFVPMLFMLPAGLVPICVGLGLVLGSVPEVVRNRMSAERLLVVVYSSWHAVPPAIVFLAAGSPEASWDAWPVLALAVVAQFAADLLSSALREALAFGVQTFELLRVLGWVYIVDAGLTPVGLAFAVAAANEPAAVAAAVPLIALLTIFAREREQRIDAAVELSRAYRGTAFLLGDVIEADDEYTGSHSRDVVGLSIAVAEELELPAHQHREVEFAALLHDIGKIKIPSAVVNKPGSLTPEERTLIETHTLEGERLLARVGGLLGRVGVVVRSCHERWDGAGYPDGLAGDAIPLAARIVACCDAYNAMTTDRPYRPALGLDEALGEIARGNGTQFDPEVGAALIRVVTR